MASDQTIPEKVTSDQTKKYWIVLWSDYGALDAPCALKVRSKTSTDQTIAHSNVTPWSDWSAPKNASDQTECAQNSLISEWIGTWKNH